MPARLGRAARLGDRSIGHIDPGAASAVVVLRAMGEGLARP
jgi:dihydroxyacetone kinase-like protein